MVPPAAEAPRAVAAAGAARCYGGRSSLPASLQRRFRVATAGRRFDGGARPSPWAQPACGRRHGAAAPRAARRGNRVARARRDGVAAVGGARQRPGSGAPCPRRDRRRRRGPRRGTGGDRERARVVAAAARGAVQPGARSRAAAPAARSAAGVAEIPRSRRRVAVVRRGAAAARRDRDAIAARRRAVARRDRGGWCWRRRRAARRSGGALPQPRASDRAGGALARLGRGLPRGRYRRE